MGRPFSQPARPLLSQVVNFRGPFLAFVLERNLIRDRPYPRLQLGSSCMLVNSNPYPLSGETKPGPSLPGIGQSGRVRM
jgi:hypothetical protein